MMHAARCAVRARGLRHVGARWASADVMAVSKDKSIGKVAGITGTQLVHLWDSVSTGEGQVKELQERCRDLSADDKVGLLYLAAAEGSSALCKTLVDTEHISPNVIHDGAASGVAPLHVAASKGHLEACIALLDCGADVNLVTDNGETPLMSAVKADKADIVALLLERGAFKGLPEEDDYATVSNLCKKGSRIESMLRYGSEKYVRCNEATREAMKGLSEDEKVGVMMHAAAHNIVDELEMVLSLGVRPDVLKLYTKRLAAPLHIAARKGHIDACKALLDSGANVNIVTEAGQTPLTSAVQAKQVDVVALLLERGAVKGLKKKQQPQLAPVAAVKEVKEAPAKAPTVETEKQLKVGFIGGGAMGGAMLEGMVKEGVVKAEDITVAEVIAAQREKISEKYGCKVTDQAVEAVQNSDVVIVCVKPNMLNDVMAGVRHVSEGKLFVSIAAGVDLDTLQSTVDGVEGVRWVRVMPNIACTLGESASSFTPDANCSEKDVKMADKILNACGKSFMLKDESLLNAATGVAGSGIAYVFLFIEALADGGVRAGLPRATSLELAAQTVLGASKMILSTPTPTHPGVLKDSVCSPAGTTIEAVAALERNGLRSAVIEAVNQASERSAALGAAAKAERQARHSSKGSSRRRHRRY
eukprot:TRINITY_DN2357_c0_g1_i1.p1 TRINITY_DN2357_c0_g1~~TRINITY_DN2357_c0_g1_i1.p1  ORF type:complete len:664 (+),score=275.58 TRINITY_DN2357_c0_g1_i1:58-1992(+)